jgi:hypothetical protein
LRKASERIATPRVIRRAGTNGSAGRRRSVRLCDWTAAQLHHWVAPPRPPRHREGRRAGTEGLGRSATGLN